MVLSATLLLLLFLSLKYDLVVTYNDSAEIQYYGEKFPTKYLIPEETLPKMEHLKLYVRSLKRTAYYFNQHPNKTDCNIALGAYFTKAILKRSLRDYSARLPKHEHRRIKDIIEECENIVSHFIYINNPYGFDDIEFRVSRPFIYDDAQIYSIGEFQRGRMNRWIYSNIRMNDYAKEMDEMTFPRLKYVDVTTRPREYYINADDSDLCLSRIVYEQEPINLSDLKPCKPDKFCFNRLHSSPSVSYTLSHRVETAEFSCLLFSAESAFRAGGSFTIIYSIAMYVHKNVQAPILLNIMLRRHLRRCYLRSAEEDQSLMELLCAFMYREAVYLARRGFFARDIFLEHIALCSMLGYEEFHRLNWFNKAVSWMDQEGCIKEARNLEYNMTRVQIERMGESDPRTKMLRKGLRKNMYNDCHSHPMALLLVVLAHGIRYVGHHLPTI